MLYANICLLIHLILKDRWARPCNWRAIAILHLSNYILCFATSYQRRRMHNYRTWEKPSYPHTTSWPQSIIFAYIFHSSRTLPRYWPRLDAYSGAVMFVAFLSEMRRPMDFWKGLLLAQTFISFVYIFFGTFVSLSSFKLSLNNKENLSFRST